jgi:protein O-mannosyl-transferase
MSRPRSRTQAKQVPEKIASTAFGGRDLMYMGLLLIAIAVAYKPLFSNSFIDYDDPDYITGNPHVLSGLTLETWSWAWTSLRSANWHPLTWVSHAIDVDLFGLNPAGHHLTSLFIHALNAVLLYLVLSRITPSKGRCLAAAALFGLHPLAVESVAWAAERKNVLCTVFFLLAIAAYGWYARGPSALRYVGVALAFALALSAKPMAITLPFVLLLLDFWPLGRVEGVVSQNLAFPVPQRSMKKLLLEKLPLLVLCLASAAITLIAQASAGALASSDALPFSVRFANAIYSYFDYILKALWPSALAPFYPRSSLAPIQIGAALLCFVGVSVIVWMQRAKRPYLIIGWLFYLGTLVPVIGLIQVGKQAMADRYTYIPMIGIFVAVVWLVGDFTAVRNWHRVSQALTLAAIVVLAALANRQVRYWHDDVRLWSYNLEVTTNNLVAEDNLGIALLKEGRTEEALAHFYRASRLSPDDPISAANVATDLLAHGRPREAIAEYEVALNRAAFIPMLLPNIHSNLGSAYLSLGDLDRARDHYKAALELNPEDQVARSGLGKIDPQNKAISPAK